MMPIDDVSGADVCPHQIAPRLIVRIVMLILELDVHSI
jgi:hypothetical protein